MEPDDIVGATLPGCFYAHVDELVVSPGCRVLARFSSGGRARGVEEAASWKAVGWDHPGGVSTAACSSGQHEQGRNDRSRRHEREKRVRPPGGEHSELFTTFVVLYLLPAVPSVSASRHYYCCHPQSVTLTEHAAENRAACCPLCDDSTVVRQR